MCLCTISVTWAARRGNFPDGICVLPDSGREPLGRRKGGALSQRFLIGRFTLVVSPWPEHQAVNHYDGRRSQRIPEAGRTGVRGLAFTDPECAGGARRPPHRQHHGCRARRHSDAGKSILRSLFRHAARRAGFFRSQARDAPLWKIGLASTRAGRPNHYAFPFR